MEVYEAYYRALDPKNTNMIQAMDAAKFLKKSGLSDVVLSRVRKNSFMGDVSALSLNFIALNCSISHRIAYFRCGTCQILKAKDTWTSLGCSSR